MQAMAVTVEARGSMPVLAQLFAREPQELERGDAVACQVAMQLARRGIARLSGVADEHLPPAPAENQRGAEASRAASHDHDVVHASVGCKS